MLGPCIVMLATALLVGIYTVLLMLRIEKYHVDLQKSVDDILRLLNRLEETHERARNS